MNRVGSMMWPLMALLFVLMLLAGCGKKMVKGSPASDQYAQSGDRVKAYGQQDSLSSIMRDGLRDGDNLQIGESSINSSLVHSPLKNSEHSSSEHSLGEPEASSAMDMLVSGDHLPPGESYTLTEQRLEGSFPGGAADRAAEVVPLSLETLESGAEQGFGDNAGNPLTEKGVTFSHNLRDVHFQFDSWRLESQAQDILEANAEWLKAHPHEHVTIEGHCDERGTQSYNYVLGEKRAAMVQQYLTFLGVSPVQMHVASFGKDRPACRTMNADCFEQNRRAHFQTNVNMVSQ